jgi:predicted nucleic acid-binding Zn ribbon protein
MDPFTRRTTAFRAGDPDPADAPAATDRAETFHEAPKVCTVCGRPLRGRQVSACSGACRIERTRRTRRDLLVARIEAAEAALRQAADALGLLREVASDATVLSLTRAP